jgi:hypothetical protein
MENKNSKIRYYSSLIWLLITSYEKDKGYSPSKYLLDSLASHVNTAAGGIPVELCDSTFYDFTVTSQVGDFFNMFFDKTKKFETGLIIIPFSEEKYILRDFYLANIAKQYTCWDTVYVNCSCPDKVTTQVFDWVLTPSDLPHKLTDIIKHEKEET